MSSHDLSDDERLRVLSAYVQSLEQIIMRNEGSLRSRTNFAVCVEEPWAKQVEEVSTSRGRYAGFPNDMERIIL